METKYVHVLPIPFPPMPLTEYTNEHAFLPLGNVKVSQSPPLDRFDKVFDDVSQ